MRLFFFLAFYVLCSCALSSETQKSEKYVEPRLNEIFPIPDRYDLVNDNWGALSITKAIDIRNKLRILQRDNGTQIVVLVVPSTGAEGVERYSQRVFEKWNIGNNGQGNGVLFLLEASGNYYIRTGAGVSGALPDSRLQKIIRDQIEPNLRDVHSWAAWDMAIEAAVDAMIKATQGEETERTYFDYDYQPWKMKPEHIGIGLLTISGFLYIGVLIFIRRRNNHRGDQR